MSKAKIHLYLRKSHRSVGVLLSFFLVLLSVTGVMLNHTEDFALSKSFVPSFIAARYYSSEEVLKGFYAKGHYFYVTDGSLYLDTQILNYCDNLKGLATIGDKTVVLCGEELLVLTKDYELVERLNTSLGLPLNLQSIAADKEKLVLITSSNTYEFDVETLALTESKFVGDVNVEILVPATLALQQSISWQQFILDLHSGIILSSTFGKFGKLFADLVAFCLCGMAVSGIAMWLRKA